MKAGSLIYDWDYGLHGLVTEVSECGQFCAVMYEDGVYTGQLDVVIRANEIEVVSESR